MIGVSHPFDWHFHLFWTLAVPALFALYLGITRTPPARATRRQVLLFACALLVWWIAVLWPLGDLAAHWSLVALVLQRLLLMLAVPPMLVAGTPRPIIERLTRPAPIDAILRVAVKPIPAIAIVTVIAVGTLTTGVVSQAAHSDLARIIIELLVLSSGFVLWAPALVGHLPGTARLSALGRCAYLMVQSIVPSFLSIVWIFAKRPLYASYNHHASVVGMSPVLDQQLAGFAAKFCTIAVLWTVAFIIVNRGGVLAGAEEEAEPLLWTDVEREIERAERRERRERRPETPPDSPDD